MAKTDSIKTDFYINYLTQAQFDALETKEADQIYLTPDASITEITAGDGLSGGGTSGVVSLGHSNSVSAKSTKALYPISFDAQGHITGSNNAVTVPTITLNGSSTTSPSFYAPTSAGTSGYFLKSNGSGAPSWVSKPTYTASEVGALPSSHTYTTSIAESTGANQITLGYGKKYSLTAGGTSYVFTMPSADDTNTWRTIQVNGSDILTGGTGTGKLNLKAGTNVSLSNSSGTVTINGPDLSSYALKSEIPTVSYPVTSVNSKTGAVSLTASDVGALASNTTYVSTITTTAGTHTTISSKSGAVSFNIPTKTSHLSNDSGFITSYTDTKDTAGSSNKTGTKMFLVAATSQSSSITTYSNSNCYIGTDNCLYSGGSKVLTSHQTITSSTVTNALGYTPYDSANPSGYTTNTGTVTKVTAGTGLSIGTTSGGNFTTTGTINHTNSVTAGTVGTSSATSGSTLAVPYVTYDAQGHITATGTHTHTVSGFLSSHQTIKQDGVTGATANRYAVCSTAADTKDKTATITTGTFTLEAGARVTVLFSNKNTAASPTLNINSTGAKNIVYYDAQNGRVNAASWQLYGMVDLIYDGTYYEFANNPSPLLLTTYESTTSKHYIPLIPSERGGYIRYNTSVYVTGGKLYSGGTEVLTSHQTITKAMVTSALGTGSGTTKFLREDGSWATPAYTTNTDTKLQVAEITSGTQYYPIVGTGTTAATRQYDTTGFTYVGTNGTANGTNGNSLLILGNSTASTTANWKKGTIRLYGTTAYYTDLVSGAPTSSRTITFPNATGTVALTSDIPTVPTISLNGSSTTSPSFYAPTSAGTSGYYLKSNGSGAPTWAAFPTIPSDTKVTQTPLNGTNRGRNVLISYNLSGSGETTADTSTVYKATNMMYNDYGPELTLTSSSDSAKAISLTSAGLAIKTGDYRVNLNAITQTTNHTINLPNAAGTLALNTLASSSAAGLMSKDDKTKLDNTTNYITEQGTNGVWTYRKWSDGTAECWANVAGSWSASFTQMVSGTFSNADWNTKSQALPTNLFTSVTYGNVNAITNAYTSTQVCGLSTTAVTFRLWNSYVSTVTIYSYQLHVKGTWK